MAEYLHLYNEDEDCDLRGTTYHIAESGWTPATFLGDLDQGTVTESIELLITAATQVGVETAISTLNRLLSEAERRADLSRYPNTQTYLKHRVDAATADYDYRLAEVVGGSAKRVGVVGRRTVCATATEFWAVVVLTVIHRCPFGYYEVLQNRVVNESFEVDSDADGLADNWEEVGDAAGQTATQAAVDNRYGVWGQRLQYAGVAADVGIKSDAIVVSAETEYVLKVWLDNNNTTRAVTVLAYDETGGAVIAASAVSFTAGEAPSLKSATFSTPAGCVSVTVRATVATADAAGDWTIDAVYLSETVPSGAPTLCAAPQGWSSYYSLVNHDDGPANSTHRNWLLVADVPGDVEALLENQVQILDDDGSSFLSPFLCCRRVGADVFRGADASAAQSLFWLQAENGTPSAGFALDTDADASGPAADNCRDQTMAVAYGDYLYWEIVVGAAAEIAGVYRPILFCKRTGAAVTLTAYLALFSQGIQTDEVTEAIGTAFQAVRFGLLRIPAKRPSELYPERALVVLYPKGSATEEIRFDGLLLMQCEDEFGEIPDVTAFATTVQAGDAYWMSGEQHQALLDTGTYVGPVVEDGLVCHLTPHMPQRLTYLFLEESSGTELWLKDVAFPVELTYRPRYRSL